MIEPSINNVVDFSKRSRCPLCLSQGLGLAGFTPIPLIPKEGRPVPGLAWGNIILPEDPLERVGKVRELFSKGEVVGVALKAGASSGLIVLDIDHPERFESFYPLQKLIDQAPYVVETKDKGHYHIGFAYDPELAERSRNFLNEAGFELKSNGSLVNFFTVLPEAQYKLLKLEPLRPMPQELKEKLLDLLQRYERPTPKESPEPQKPKDLDPQKIIELASEVYQKGQRQFWAIYTAGYLRKLGFSFEEIKEALEKFLREQGDEELNMRLEGIEHTLQEPLENVKGIDGLVGLRLSVIAYFKLKDLEKQIGKSQAPKYFTLKDILTLEVKEPSWIIPNLLPEGFTILGGKPKIGKSWLALQIALKYMEMGKKVVYFALEDTHGRLQKRLKVLGIENPEALPDQIIFSFELPRVGKGAVKEIKKCVEEHNPGLIIIDPWAKIKPQVKGKDLFIEEYRALEALKELVKEGVSILLIHHARKTQSEDPIDEILGTTGQTAVVDNILLLKRGRGDKMASLHLILRDFEGAEIGLRFENGWRYEGDAKEAMIAEHQRKICEAIRYLESIGERATIGAIADLVGKDKGTVRVVLFDLVQKGVVFRKERGIYSLSDFNPKRANFTNFTNFLNFLNFINFPNFLNFINSEDQKLGKVSSGDKNELTFLSQNLQGLQEKVKKVSKVSKVSQFDIKPSDLTFDPNQTSTSFEIEPEGISDKTRETEGEEGEGEVVYFLMPEGSECERCGFEVWKVRKSDLGKRVAYGKCAKCRHVSFLGDLSKGRILSKADVEFFLMRLEN